MGAAIRAAERGRRLGERFLRDTGTTFHDTRIGLGLSQGHVAKATSVSRTRYGRIEAGQVSTLSILELARIAVVLGLDPSVRLYPGGLPVRDSAHAARLRRLIERVHAPLLVRTEVPLPARADRTELRAWDLVVTGRGERTTIELEMRLFDVQALERRMTLKRRDDPAEHFLLAVADTRANRRVLIEFRSLFPDLPRLPRSRVFAAFENGIHPGTGIVLV